MSLLPSNRDYTDKDFEALKSRMFDLIRSVFPTWTNFAIANFQNVLVESFCWITDNLTFYQDQQAGETRFGTVQLRKNMVNLAKLIGYVLPGASAASADVVITITNASALSGTVALAAGSKVVVKTESVTSPVRGEIISPLPFEISVAEGSKTFQWEESLTQPVFAVVSTNLADQRYLLPNGPFLDDGSETIETPTQGFFERVTSFYNSDPTDRHYRVQIDKNERAEIIFGSGTQGEIPVGDITINYRVGGGIFGNVEAGTLVKVEGSFVDTNGNPAYLVASNPAAAEGGLPREEIAASRINAPASLTALNRTVGREDYEVRAESVNGVGRALMLTSNEFSGVGENRGQLYIVPSTGGVASQALIDAVQTICTITYPNTVTFQLETLTASFLTIHVRVVVFFRQDVVPSEGRAEIVAALSDFFAPMLASGAKNPYVDFGYNYKDEDGEPAGEIAWSDIHNVVRDSPSVRKVDPGSDGFTLNGVRSDVAIPVWQFPALGNVTVINGKTGTEI